ncbi:uncharacterized protein LOC112089821 [Eutrema salsugineum]|uniref:uncharacterized protein LOC112089821 n=1 Tax=Eutrema salsugineum TaxID=72664 RepID=UPI000CED5231|nr:uncharacterized protein LOC112089821 [Eutrema salsugineum]
MALDDYMLDGNTDSVSITYALPDSMLANMAPDTHPMHITNDRQVQSLIGLSKMHAIRLCVSSCKDNDGRTGGVDAADGCSVEGGNQNTEEGEDENVDEYDDDEINEDIKNDSVKEEDSTDSEGQDSEDQDYSQYGKVKDEDSNSDLEGEGEWIEEPVKAPQRGYERNWVEKIKVNGSFATKDDLISEIRLTAVMLKFAFRVDKSSRHLFVAKCAVKGCQWRVRAAVKNEAKTFWVTKYVKTHTCLVSDRLAHRKHTTPRYIGKLFIERVGIIDGITAEHIKDSMQTMFQLKIDYTTSYRALMYAQECVRGSLEDGYSRLPSYLRLIAEANPGTITALERDSQNRFKYLFLAFRASIAGFQYLRRVIVVDGCHLTGKYEGTLLVTTTQDSNFQIFPLAFGIVDSENDHAWEWFFRKLRECFTDEYPLVIVSDRHHSIKKACETVLPWVTCGICYYHLQHNIVTKFKGKHLMYLVKRVAYAYTVHDFNRYMDEIRHIKPDLATYLEEAGIQLWSRVHFPGDKYNIKTRNIAESINSALKRARGFPIVFLLEYLRAKLTKWFCKRREDALSLPTNHTRGVEYLLAIRSHYADKLTVEGIDGWRFNVKGGSHNCVVDLEIRKCGCGVYDIEKIPCSHVIAVSDAMHMHLATLVCPTYSKDYLYAAYSHNIYPPSIAMKTDETTQCLPPEVRRKKGRQRKSRWQTWLEISRHKQKKPRKIHKQYSCSKCHQPGHTRPDCVSVMLPHTLRV